MSEAEPSKNWMLKTIASLKGGGGKNENRILSTHVQKSTFIYL